MNKIPNNIKYLVFGISGISFLILNFGLGAKIYVELTELLLNITDYYFGFSANTIDYLYIASIPIFGMLYNSTRKEFKILELIMDILTILFWTILVIGIGLYILIFVGKSSNPLTPEYLLIEPFDFYSTIFIGIGILTPFLFLKLIKKLKNEKQNTKHNTV